MTTDTRTPEPFVAPGGIRGETDGDGRPIVLLHGLTATRRYVVMGSRHLARNGFRTVAFDARGHGESDPAPAPGDYEYHHMVGDLVRLMDELGIESALLAGNSMGAATAAALALRLPARVEGLVLVTPGYPGEPREDELEGWDALADGLERGGVEGFLEAYEPPSDPRFREAALKFTRQRIERHRHPQAVADALRVVPRSQAFGGLVALDGLEAPSLVIGSRDDSDPGHPLALAEAYAEHLGARLLVEDEGKSPIAWQGAQISRAIEKFAAGL